MSPSTQRKRLIRELAAFRPEGAFEDILQNLAHRVAELLAARRVSLMLLDTGNGKGPRLKLAALHGELPDDAWKEEPKPGQGVAGQVLLTGKCLRVANIGSSSFRATARHPTEGGSFLACPLLVAGQPAGVLNVSGPVERLSFSALDMEHAELAALLIARVIQITRLERLCDSRIAQMAFALERTLDAPGVTALSAHNPDKVAKMLAKSFFKEMRHCGFSPNQIIHAAGEIISELTGSLNRHTRRIERER